MQNNSKVSLDDEVHGLLATQNKAGDTTEMFHSLTKEKVQMGFIRKVYGILTAQILITFGFAAFAVNSPRLASFMDSNNWLVIVSLVISLVALYSLVCFVDFQRRVPYNYLTLLLFTVCEAYIIAYFCLAYSPSQVYEAGFMAAAMCIGLTIYACFTTTDFTLWGGFLFMAGLVFVIGGSIMLIFRTPLLLVIFDCIGLLLFGFYLIYDTQLILGSKSAVYSVDDYIMATMNLYLDIVNIFLDILSLVGRK